MGRGARDDGGSEDWLRPRGTAAEHSWREFEFESDDVEQFWQCRNCGTKFYLRQDQYIFHTEYLPHAGLTPCASGSRAVPSAQYDFSWGSATLDGRFDLRRATRQGGWVGQCSPDRTCRLFMLEHDFADPYQAGYHGAPRGFVREAADR